jgi:hypothetical protein
MNDYPEDMQALQLHLLKGIKDHVQSCIHHYSAGAFVVMKHHADSPYDYHLYTLGKCGKRSFKPSAVKAIIAPAAEGTWDEQFAYQQIILAIKKLYRQNQLDHHSAHALSELSQFSVSRPLIQETPEKSKKSACVRCIIL